MTCSGRLLFPALMVLVTAGGCASPDPNDHARMPFRSPDPQIEQIVGEISIDSMAEILQQLAAFETRHTLSDTGDAHRGIGAAWRWIHDTFQGYSPRLQVSYDSHIIQRGDPGRLPVGTFVRNVVAVLPGSDPELAGRHIVMGGHYDSLNLDPVREGDPYARNDPNRPAPGVNDDGTGTALAMEMARVFSRYEFPKTLVFIAFSAEEQGLVGASLYARRAREAGLEIEAVLNVDMIGNVVRGGGAPSFPNRVRVFSEGPEDSPSRQIARYMERTARLYVPEAEVDLIFRHDRFGRGGDHTAFNRLGYPGVRLVEANEDYSRQHSYDDTFENIDRPYLLRNARVQAAAAAMLAWAPAAPQVGRLGRQPSGYDARLRFAPAVGPDIAGYVVTMRGTTAPQWEVWRWVEPEEIDTGPQGRILEVILPLEDIDDRIYGVAAVNRRGIPSLVSPFTQ